MIELDSGRGKSSLQIALVCGTIFVPGKVVSRGFVFEACAMALSQPNIAFVDKAPVLWDSPVRPCQARRTIAREFCV
jgi:hypothetical protein